MLVQHRPIVWLSSLQAQFAAPRFSPTHPLPIVNMNYSTCTLCPLTMPYQVMNHLGSIMFM